MRLIIGHHSAYPDGKVVNATAASMNVNAVIKLTTLLRQLRLRLSYNLRQLRKERQ